MLQIRYQNQIYQFIPHDNIKLKNEGTYGNGSIDWAPRGLSLDQIAAQVGVLQPIAARINKKIVPLDTFITKNCEVEFITLSDAEGQMMLRRTGIFLLNYAAMQVFPSDYQLIESNMLSQYTVYTDFILPEAACITDADLESIQNVIIKILQEDTKIVAKKLPYFRAVREAKALNRLYLLRSIEMNDDGSSPVSVYMLHDYFDLDSEPLLLDIQMIKELKNLRVEKKFDRNRIIAELCV
ncbi:MAG: hypothetical protein J6B76_10915 [Peptococcaceae bacterium]|nr:hypothetical protein [Peptococcaceae bacterium]